MQLTFLSLIYFIACSHAVLLSLALWRQSEQGQSGKILAILLLVLAYKMFEGAVSYSNVYQMLPHLLGWLPGAVLLIGPIFWGYVKRATGEPPLSFKQWFIHLLPALLLICINTPQLFILASEKIANIERYNAFEGTPILPARVIIFLIILKCHLASYLNDSWLILSRFNQQVANLRADMSSLILTRLKQLCIALIALEALWVILFILQQTTGFIALEYVSKAWLLFIAVIVLSMGYYGLKQPNLIFSAAERAFVEYQATAFAKHQPKPLLTSQNIQDELIATKDIKQGNTSVVYLSDNNATEPFIAGNKEFAANPLKNTQVNKIDKTSEKYSQSTLSDSVAQQVSDLIMQVMEREKVYLDDKLTLSVMAEKLDLKPHLVSQVINQHMSSSFYKLVNKYRVLYAVALLEQVDNSWSLERIAYESGFGNRVTFNSAFKELKGCTASVYRKNNKSVSQLVS